MKCMSPNEDEPNNSQVDAYFKQIEKAEVLESEMRGRFLSGVVALETMMDSFLAKHFCYLSGQMDLFVSLVLRKLDYRRKQEIISTLLKQHYPELATQFKSLDTDLLAIAQMRNKLAHLQVELDSLKGESPKSLNFFEY